MSHEAQVIMLVRFPLQCTVHNKKMNSPIAQLRLKTRAAGLTDIFPLGDKWMSDVFNFQATLYRDLASMDTIFEMWLHSARSEFVCKREKKFSEKKKGRNSVRRIPPDRARTPPGSRRARLQLMRDQ